MGDQGSGLPKRWVTRAVGYQSDGLCGYARSAAQRRHTHVCARGFATGGSLPPFGPFGKREQIEATVAAQAEMQLKKRPKLF